MYNVGMKDSIFTKIIKGEIPCHKVYEDDRTFAFMDIHPIQPGHVLVISKTQVSNFFELEGDDYSALFATVKKVALKLKEQFPTKRRIGVMIEGLEVDHVHVKVFPVDTPDQYRAHPDLDAEPDHAALADMAKRLAF